MRISDWSSDVCSSDLLVLVQHRRTLDEDSPPVRLLSPAGTENAYFLQIGWSGEGVELPDANTAWTASAPVLAPDSPVTLSWANGTGQRFEIGLAIDDDYMFTIRSEEHTSELQSLMRNSYAVFCLKKKKT